MKQLLRNTPLHFYYQKARFWRWDATDERRLAFYRQLVNDGELVFDVGANVGNRSKIFLKLGARVVAFEPQDNCAALLESVLRNEPRFTLVTKALGAEQGSAQMLISDASVLSTLSSNWIDAAKKSGRLREWSWGKAQTVQVTTLDQMIALHGHPAFIKIDVEGFELEVMRGLTTPVRQMSFEFASETLDRTFGCIDHLLALDPSTRFQVSLGESMEFDLADWVPAGAIKECMSNLVDQDAMAWGDVYARSELRAS
jgi:FkbM family methyltransferase